MSEKRHLDSKKTLVAILGVIGVILMIAGVAIITIHNPLRGSGLGTISLVIGLILLIVALFIFFTKHQ